MVDVAISKEVALARYKISNRHLPPAEKAIDARYPFADMQIGDSILVPRSDVRDIIQLRQTCLYYARKHEGFRFSVRSEKAGFRVYRVNLWSRPSYKTRRESLKKRPKSKSNQIGRPHV